MNILTKNTGWKLYKSFRDVFFFFCFRFLSYFFVFFFLIQLDSSICSLGLSVWKFYDSLNFFLLSVNLERFFFFALLYIFLLLEKLGFACVLNELTKREILYLLPHRVQCMIDFFAWVEHSTYGLSYLLVVFSLSLYFCFSFHTARKCTQKFPSRNENTRIQNAQLIFFSSSFLSCFITNLMVLRASGWIYSVVYFFILLLLPFHSFDFNLLAMSPFLDIDIEP